jgi:hypothetical protein
MTLQDHLIDQECCPSCWQHTNTDKCDNCGGRIHNEFYEEDYDNVYLEYLCDKCGSKDKPINY